MMQAMKKKPRSKTTKKKIPVVMTGVFTDRATKDCACTRPLKLNERRYKFTYRHDFGGVIDEKECVTIGTTWFSASAEAERQLHCARSQMSFVVLEEK